VNYGAAGLVAAAGLAASLATALDAAAPASLAIAAGAAADAAASGAGAVSSVLLQAVAKNIETNARSRTLRIAFSLVGAQFEPRKLETRREYDRRGVNFKRDLCRVFDGLSRAAQRFFLTISQASVSSITIRRLQGRMRWRWSDGSTASYFRGHQARKSAKFSNRRA
jgi:hypothetical protein